MHYAFILFLVFVMAGGCNSTRTTPNDDTPTKDIPSTLSALGYDFERPTETRELPEELTEISGLSMETDGSLLAVQDEEGSIFHITPDSIYEYPFRKKGDYEGIERVGEDVFVVKNTGTIYRVSDFESEPSVEKFKYFLDDSYDIEGLGYDSKSKGLLLACKAEGKLEENSRAVYRFDVATNQLDADPFMVLDVDAIYAYISKHVEGNESFKKLLKKVEENGEKTFAPSAIAIHPHTGQLYFSSSQGKMLLVTDRTGKVMHLEKLDKGVFPQPEGLAFDKDGNLFISNEGKDGKGKIHQLKWAK